ncbi:MAG: hypothetical protein QXR53_02240 [Candidatus Norongarragalinales archaeon]
MLKLKENASKLLFLGVFAVAGLIAMRINFSQALGAPNQFFTLFQFFAPIAGGFLGTALGAAVVLITQFADFVFVGKEATLLNVARLFTLSAAAWYFGTNSKQKWAAAIPAIAIVLFVLHPVGAQAWYFAVMFWSVPILAKFFYADNLLAKSLGATLTAHAVGGVLWLYALPTTPAFWTGLIPIVVYERLLFAVGIAASFVALNALFSRVRVPSFVRVDETMPLVVKAKQTRLETN